jgi:murein DD-endopeptidase MepM/ murein hydrolase activator NlpD
LAAHSGTVENVTESDTGYGNCVLLNHGNGVKTRYAHMEDIYVKKGETVSMGAKIGTVGSTGNSTGPHLHFEIILDTHRQNPLRYISPTRP